MSTSVGKAESEAAMKQAAPVLRRYRVHLALVAGNVAFAAIFIAVALSGFH